jgi:hypothetical protein
MQETINFRRMIVEQAFSLKSQAPDMTKEENEEYKDTVQDVKLVRENYHVSIPFTY